MSERIVHKVIFPANLPDAPFLRRRVAAYARVSTGTMEQEGSLEAQKSYFESYIRDRSDWEFVGLYSDDGISGLSNRNREGFNRMINDALQGEIDLIVTKSLSRFARNTVDSLNTIRALKTAGVEVYFQKEDIYTFDSKGEFMITLMSVFAQEESRSISENVTWGHRKRFSDGKYFVPFKHFLGYKRGADGSFEIEESTADIVKFIYWLFLQKHTTPGYIARLLTSMGIPTPAGMQNWSQSVICSVLTNEKYVGDAMMQKKFTVDYLTKKCKPNEGELPKYYVEDAHPAIIPRPAWNEVQTLLSAMPRRNNAHRRYSNMLICSQCGTTYGPKRWFTPGNPGYHRTVWECNRRYAIKHDPIPSHFYDEELLTAFCAAAQHLFKRECNTIRHLFRQCCDPETFKRIEGTLKNPTLKKSTFAASPQDSMTFIECGTAFPSDRIDFKYIDRSHYEFIFSEDDYSRRLRSQ